ncbi:hypothetical protein HPB52_013617 [Rhipicephalus sanguineus]|uniref:Uncharacterized protein n=1 Tax=Rhipicephalus sanguineus TaxID=34632 RepID=A0A9D4T0B5_RHISA|nr:hypothetical protein HPB52_013617 [Rhipicephalus sanguineus]
MTQEDPCYYNRDQQNKSIRRTRAASVLLELLRQHCCIAAIDVNAALARRPHLLKAIAESCPVTSLAVFSCDMKTQEANNVRRLVGSLRHTLQELEINCEADGFENMARRVLAKVVCDSGNFLSMRRLDLTHADMNLFSAEKIIAGLSRNKVIEELAVDSSLFTCGSQRLGEDFTSYLRYAKPNLKKLTIRQSRNCRSRALKSLTATLARMKYLEEVNVYAWTKASVLTEAFSKVARNRSLRTLRIERKTSDMEFMMDDDQSISRWLQTLQTNNTLEELVINLSCFTADDCLLFLVAVAANRNLTRVDVGTIMPRGRVADICELIRGKDLVDRLFIRQWIIGPQDVAAIAGLPEVTSVRLCRGRFEVSSTFESAFHVVAACDHVTTLHVDLEELCGDGGYQTAMSDYIGAAAVLKDLTILHLRNNDCQHESQEDCAKARMHTELHGFMRIAGVVRHQVQCFERTDGRVQLDSLNEYCWLHIRQYLKVADVRPQRR